MSTRENAERDADTFGEFFSREVLTALDDLDDAGADGS
jgi:hypothetical protein